jgi:hypothetical protein
MSMRNLVAIEEIARLLGREASEFATLEDAQAALRAESARHQSTVMEGKRAERLEEIEEKMGR